MTMNAATLLLTRREVADLLSLDECILAVEEAFRLHAEGKTLSPGVLGVPAREGGFHIKAAGLHLARTYVAVKVNGNFPRNPECRGLPSIQGVIVLCDADNGTPLAIMDSIEITILRTGAATAVAARYLARHKSKVATICGCGNQGRIQLKALTRVRPIERVYAFDSDETVAWRFAADLSRELGIEVEPTRDLGAGVRRSDICVTCTPSRRPLLKPEDVVPGTFIAAVGADSPEKQELDPTLLVSNTVVADLLTQCETMGELHHAFKDGLISRKDVHAELGEVIAGRRPGRTSEDEIIIFDSTGTALQDAVAAAVVYEKAVGVNHAIRVNLAS
jgi:alanine dehydrogenase